MTTQHTNRYGYDRIAKVEGEVFYEMSGDPIHEIIWITTTRGEIVTDELQRGETLEGRVAHYQARGWTDDRCVFFKSATDKE